ncbi:MAG: hypothetical protein ABMA13_10775 [Chthoniobacteraceae bacterium]
MNSSLHPLQIERLRRLSLSERFARGLRFLRSTRAFLSAGVRSRHPDWTDEQVRAETQRLIRRARD